ncbi:MAG: hypothetical protein Q9194_003150 [Teloschistes cf. exilis]
MLLAAFLFLLASAGCGWAPNMPFFIAARAVSGMGGGGMTGLSFVIIADSFPLDDRPKYQSILMSGFGIAAVLGPILGGVFTKELTWRWCFWVNLPIVGFTFIILLFFLHDPRDNHPSSTKVTSFFDNGFQALRRVDWNSSILFAGAITCFILPISLGGDYWPWASPQIPVLLVVSVVSLIGFITNTFVIDQDKALIPFRMMECRPLLAAWANLFFYSVCFLSFLYYMPVWFQVVQHRNPTVTGLLLLPYLFGLVIVGIVYAFLLRQSSKVLSILHTDNRHRKRLILIIGAILFLIGITLISTLVHKLPLGALMVVLLLFGAGSGLVLQTSFLEAQAAVSPNANALPTEAAREAVRGAFEAALLLTLKGLVGFAAAVLVISIFFVGGNDEESQKQGVDELV